MEEAPVHCADGQQDLAMATPAQQPPLPARLVVFARLPTPGQCKTRLAATIGAEAAAECYRLCAQHAFCEAHRCAAVVAEVHCSDASEVEGMEHWLANNGTAMPVRVQLAHPDLGARMHHALAAAAASAAEAGVEEAKVLIIGTDIPNLSTNIIAAAFAALDTADLVFGPAVDGGYYLLGVRAKALAPGLFEGVPWSTDEVFAATRARAAALGVVCAPIGVLPVLQDIDTREDLAAWLASCGPDAAGANAGDTGIEGAGHGQAVDTLAVVHDHHNVAATDSQMPGHISGSHPLYAYAASCLQH